MKTIFRHLLHALIIWACTPDGAEWNAAAENIFAERV